MDDKIVKVIFKEGWETMYNNDLTQGDYGLALQIEGITLPDGNVEVHFSLTEHSGEAPISIGTVKDNVITVDIPDFILTKNNTCNSSYEAYAWIYVTDGESGRTIRKIVFTIDKRAEPTPNVPESKKDPFLEEVRQVMAETKEIAQSARDDADNGEFNGPQGPSGKDGKSAYQYAVEGGFEGTEEEFTELIAQAGHVDLTGYVTKEEHEAELLKTMVKVTTDKAPYHHITDSANMKVVDFGMEGKIEQRTTSGTNYLNIAELEKGLLYNASGSVGSTDGYDKIYRTFKKNMQAGTYTIFINGTKIGIERIILNGEYKSINTVVSHYNFTVNTDSEVAICFKKENAAEFTDSEEIQINKGTTALPYEPYTNGPSPNPTHPQEIKLAGVYNEETGRYEHKCCVGNKNFITHEDIINPNGPAVGGQNGYDSVEYNEQTGEYKFLKPNKTFNSMSYILRRKLPKGIYTMSCNLVGTDGTDFSQCKIEMRNVESNVFVKNVTAKNFGEMVCTFELTENAEISIIIMQSSYYSTYTIIKDILLERNSVKTAPEIGQSQPFTLTSDRPLTMWDSLVKRDGVWGWSIWSKLYENYVVSTSSGISCASNDNYDRFYLNSFKSFQGAEGKCDIFRFINDNIQANYICGFKHSNSIIVYLPKGSVGFADGMTVAQMQTKVVEYMADKPLTICFETAEEQSFIPLPDEEQELLRNLEMYYGVTNAYNDQGCPMWFTYAADQELHWNQKLLEIQKAMI